MENETKVAPIIRKIQETLVIPITHIGFKDEVMTVNIEGW
jgi:hypothetical protein